MIISFDCAYKTLGICILDVSNDFLILKMSTISVIPKNKKIKELNDQELSIYLMGTLNKIQSTVDPIDLVIIEKQPRGRFSNNKIVNIESQIVYHFSPIAKKILVINAAAKGKVIKNVTQTICPTGKKGYYNRKKLSIQATNKILEAGEFLGKKVSRKDTGTIDSNSSDAFLQILASII